MQRAAFGSVVARTIVFVSFPHLCHECGSGFWMSGTLIENHFFHSPSRHAKNYVENCKIRINK